MSGILSKRQQARNEKALQDLVQKVPGNGLCADCQARNPSWASWSLGIFLCMRCASIHRKLGTHISKVKSLSMDSWSNEQVENMKRVGNVASNRIYNSSNKKPPVPIDADEADSAIERFIRTKYMQSGANAPRLQARDETVSDEDTPPPLPPKTGGRFGFRSTSSTFPLSFKSKKDARADAQVNSRDAASSGGLRNKPSKIFGASVHHDSADESTRKLAQLRDMGFVDERRNAMVLKGCNNNLEKTIESLVRLGEGGGVSPGGLTSPRESSLRTSRSLTPVAPDTATASLPGVSPPSTRGSASQSNNPWEIPPAQPQSSQSTGTLQNKNPFYSTNPFGMPGQQAEFALNQSLQNLSLTPSQPLFPNRTGGLPAPQPSVQAIYQQSMTPPIPQTQGFSSIPFNSNQSYPQPSQQPPNNYNPFLQTPTPQQPLSLNTNNVHIQGAYANNPFARSPTRIASPALGQIPEQTQQNFYNATQPQAQYGSNPFFSTHQQQQSPAQLTPQMTSQNPWQQHYQQPNQFAQAMPQAMPQQMAQPQRPDKASIMALYNMPHLAPQPTGIQPQNQDDPAAQSPGYQAAQPTSPPVQQPSSRSVSSPLPGANNPFMANGVSSPPAAPSSGIPSAGVPTGARSRESMNLGMDMGWNNGRHSPDAFASLSARSR